MGVFLGLRCATRARACHGASRGRWLLLAAVAIGSTGIWAMDFLALLGFSVVGETTRYNVLVAHREPAGRGRAPPAPAC